MSIGAPRAMAWWAAALLVCSAQAQGPLGNAMGDRPVLVITSSYADTALNPPLPPTTPPTPPLPVIADTLWAATMQAELRPYYQTASGGQATFSFTASSTLGPAVPALVTLPYTEASTAPGGSRSHVPAGGLGVYTASNDPEVLSRDVKNVLDVIDAAVPGQLGNTFRHVVVMHRAAGKRGRASAPFPYQALVPGAGGLRRQVQLYVALIDVQPNTPMSHRKLSVVSHELGHQLGLPDLYNERSLINLLGGVVPGYPTHEFTEAWDEMAHNRMQNFSTFSRRLTGWLAPAHVLTLHALVALDRTVELAPPTRGDAARPFEAVRLMYSPATALVPEQHRPSYLIESRAAGQAASLDNPRAGPLLPGTPPLQPGESPPIERGLPQSYERGVLISHSKPWLSGANFPPLHPLEVRASQAAPPASTEQLPLAVFTPAAGRNRFVDAENGVVVEVLALRPDGGALLRVRVTPPQRPDVASMHCWLDNPGNGIGSFLMPAGPFGDPVGFGDPLFRNAIVNWAQNPPWPPHPVGVQVVTPDHLLSCRVHNWGNAPAKKVLADLHLLAPSLPVFGGPVNAAAIAALNPLKSFALDFGDIAAGASAVRSVTVAPEGPFMAGLLLQRASVDRALAPEGADELNVLNNWHPESFATVQLAPGSPYSPLDIELPVLNASGAPRVVYATVGGAAPNPLPTGWTGQLKRVDAEPLFAVLERDKQARYRLQVQPADPEVEKPGVLRALDLLAWMDEGDHWIPVQGLRLSVLLSHKTQISLAGKRIGGNRIELWGQLQWLNLAHLPKPVIDAPLIVSIDCSNGQRKLLAPGQGGHTARSNRQGSFSQVVQVPATAQCVAHAEYAGSQNYAASRSPALAIASGMAPGKLKPWLPGPR